jgi:molybdopterin-guanine dinucleotide biosynthesis protein A
MPRVTEVEPAMTIAILAGGRASRLDGEDKGLIPICGRPLIEHVVSSLLLRECDQLLIVANRNIEQYARHAPVISDEVPGFHGPLAGIATALAACSTPWLMTVPVDCPDPPPDLAQRLLRVAFDQRVDAVVVHDGVQRQPLFALYRSTLCDSARHAVAEGRGVWRWQESIAAFEWIGATSESSWLNLNTAEDIAAFLERVHAE